MEESKQSWLGYNNEEEERNVREKYQMDKAQRKKGGKRREHGGVWDDSVVHEYQMLHHLDDACSDREADANTDASSDGNISTKRLDEFSDNNEAYSETQTNGILSNASDDSNNEGEEGKEKWKEYWADTEPA